MKTVFIIDDDLYIGNVLEETLQKAGYGVTRAYSGTEAILALEKQKPDLILLDLMLPGLSGDAVLSHIRDIPVIVISARTDLDSKIQLLMGGAVDYVTKPFHIHELLARISTHLRTAGSIRQSERLSCGNITLNPEARQVQVQQIPVKLTRTEYAILKLLMQNQSQVMTKSLLLERIGMDSPDCTETSLKMHVSNLRKKLRDAGATAYIEAVWGIGFQLKEE